MMKRIPALKNYKYLFIVFLVLQVFFCLGCGGGGKNAASSDTENVYVISGKVELPREYLLNYSLFHKKICLVSPDFLPSSGVFLICDESGFFSSDIFVYDITKNFKFYVYVADELYKVRNDTDIRPGVANIDGLNFITCVYSSEGIIKDKTITFPKIVLGKGEKSLKFKCKNKDGYPIKNIEFSADSISMVTDARGTLRTPAFPDNVDSIRLNTFSFAFDSISDFSIDLFTKVDEEEILELTLPEADIKSAVNNNVMIAFKKTNLEPNLNEEVILEAQAENFNYFSSINESEITWSCTDGSLTPMADKTKIRWLTPNEAGLASVTVTIKYKESACSATLGFGVGGSRKINSRINSFSPLQAAAGQTVTISGFGFGEQDETSKVYIGDILAQILSWNQSEIKILVPDEAENGNIKVVNGNKTVISDEILTVKDYNTTVSVMYGLPGTEITIRGYAFGDTKATNSAILYDNEEINNIVSWNNREIKYKVETLIGDTPKRAALDLVIRGRKRNLGLFSVSHISSVTPTSASYYTYNGSELEPTIITVRGGGFGETPETDYGNSSVKFYSVNASGEAEYIPGEVDSWSDNEINVKIPQKALTGKMILNINGVENAGPVITINQSSGYRRDSGIVINDAIANSEILITDVLIKSDGTALLCDPQNNRMWYLDNDGNTQYLSVANSSYNYMPYVAAIASDNSIIFADWSTRRIVKYVDGAVTAQSAYAFDGNPTGICLDSSGNIYVSDSGSDRIVIFDSNLNQKSSFGSSGTGNGEFDKPAGLCFSQNEEVLFVADSGNYRVQKFNVSVNGDGSKNFVFDSWYGAYNDVAGKYTDKFGEESDVAGGFSNPVSVACDGDYLYVSDMDNDNLHKINLTVFSATIVGENGEGDGNFVEPIGIKLYNNKIYVADSKNKRVQILDKNGGFINKIMVDLNNMSMACQFLGISLDADKDSLFAIDTEICSIKKYDIYGTYMKTIGSKGSGAGQLFNPSDLALDSDNNIWAVDTGNNRLVKFSDDGIGIESYGTMGTSVGNFHSPQRIAIDSNDNIYVTDCDNKFVVKFDKNGNYLSTLGNGYLSRPFGIAVDSSGNIYVSDVDASSHRICKFSSSGVFLGWFGIAVDEDAGGWHEADDSRDSVSGTEPCQFKNPSYLAIDNNDCLFVVDNISGSKTKIQKLDTKNTGRLGGFINSVEVNEPVYGITVDNYSCFYATTENSIYKYVPVE